MGDVNVKWAVLMLVCAGLLLAGGTTKPTVPEKIDYGRPVKLCNLANQAVNESSGMACSRLAEKVFWTHNDSGDGPQVYAFDAAGRDLGTFTVRGAAARDWEDMASFKIGKKAFLLLADIGDNAAMRRTCALYIVREPAVRARAKAADGHADVAVKIVFKYEDGPHNCESAAVDAKARKIYLATKESAGGAKVYELPLAARSPGKVLVAKAVADLSIDTPVAMDISPDGLRAVILTYGPAYEYTRSSDQSWSKGFARPRRQIRMPERAQGESICYGRDGKTLYLTSEQLPTPLWKVPAVGGK